jgi:hypothetical protein
MALPGASPRRSKWSGIESAADDLSASLAPPPLTDAVEKVGGMSPTRNNRIMGAAFLNRSCAADARLE